MEHNVDNPICNAVINATFFRKAFMAMQQQQQQKQQQFICIPNYKWYLHIKKTKKKKKV